MGLGRARKLSSHCGPGPSTASQLKPESPCRGASRWLSWSGGKPGSCRKSGCIATSAKSRVLPHGLFRPLCTQRKLRGRSQQVVRQRVLRASTTGPVPRRRCPQWATS
eukprot:13308131-Alexandrium_andersonii.AAC.1